MFYGDSKAKFELWYKFSLVLLEIQVEFSDHTVPALEGRRNVLFLCPSRVQ